MPNRLADETSPYLLQHANNPVDWRAWNEESLQIAKQEDKPIFLSIGYSACHWCHVMEHESFEDQAIADYLNEHYVSIKVDREERPDLDHIYMQSVMALRGGQGGWPLSVFLTPECHVFFGGTYWPPRDRVGMPGFESIIRHVRQAFNDKRDEVNRQSQQITGWLQESLAPQGERGTIGPQLLANAAQQLHSNFDFDHGGFGPAPKFPHPMDLQLLIRLSQREESDPAEPTAETILRMVDINLDKMALGGIRDHLGGGFYRYSVDGQWLIPHFEKMLYDNAQLVRLYTESYVANGRESHLHVAQTIVAYLLRDMLDPAGGFHSSEDADSEGEEGKFYLWTPDQIRMVLGAEAGRQFSETYNVTAGGNFEGKNNLNLKRSLAELAAQQQHAEIDLEAEIESSRDRLLEARNQRVRPAKDDKILTSWNALALDAISFYAQVSGSAEVLDIANRNLDFALTRMRSTDGRLLHSFRHGDTRIHAFLDDHAYLINALLTHARKPEMVDQAAVLADQMATRFWDADQGGFFFTPEDQTDVITRYKDYHDGSIPSGNGMAAFALIRLARATGNSRWLDLARQTIEWALPFVDKSPLACGQMLLAIESYLSPSLELIIVAAQPDDVAVDGVLRTIARNWLPSAAVLCGTLAQFESSEAIHETVYRGKTAIDDRPTLYLCSGYECKQPMTDLLEIEQALQRCVSA